MWYQHWRVIQVTKKNPQNQTNNQTRNKQTNKMSKNQLDLQNFLGGCRGEEGPL